MKKIKITAGIIWAIAGLVLIINLFPGLNNFSTVLSGSRFLTDFSGSATEDSCRSNGMATCLKSSGIQLFIIQIKRLTSSSALILLMQRVLCNLLIRV
jgi:hypothetical protein